MENEQEKEKRLNLEDLNKVAGGYTFGGCGYCNNSECYRGSCGIINCISSEGW